MRVVEVSASALRAELASWLRRVAAGDQVVVTVRGIPVARLVPVTAASTVERLIAEGVLGRAESPRRPRAQCTDRVTATTAASDLAATAHLPR